MQDNNMFDPEKMSLLDFKMIKGQVDTPENFDISKVIEYQLDNTLQLSFSIHDKLAKSDFIINIKTDSKGGNEFEATGSFQLIFIYRIGNFEDLAITQENKILKVNGDLANALSSITYSTTRGVLIARLQGTALQNFMLPIINPSKLLNNNV